MTSLQLISERFTAFGGIDGGATRRAMGKPGLEFWDLFLRETLQNSWDARTQRDGGSIRFTVESRTYDAAQCASLRENIFSEVPPSLNEFQNSLVLGHLTALIVSDAGTRGLGGATRADIAPDDGDPTDFVDFVRNVGRAAKKEVGGGTYGFGKGVLYDASEINTCLIYSQTMVRGVLERRFIAMSVGEQFDQSPARFTGRHWWGVSSDDLVPEPVTGDEALLLAERFGLNVMDTRATGTSIAVLAPIRADAVSMVDVVRHLAAAAEVWAWPHRVGIGSGPSIEFAFRVDGQEVGLRDPNGDVLFQQYIRAYEQATAAAQSEDFGHQWPWTVRLIETQRPKMRLGVLAYRKVPVLEQDIEGARRVQYGHHIALMRGPRFIVKYLPIPEDPAGQATVGVFVASPEADAEFARTEPVAHDDWVPGDYQGEHRTNPVRVALNKIRAEFKDQLAGTVSARGGDHASGTAMVSRLLGNVLAGVSGHGSEAQPQTRGSGGSGGGNGGGRAPISVSVEPYPELLVIDGEVAADFGFHLTVNDYAVLDHYLVEGAPRIVLDGGALETTTDAADVPVIGGWIVDGTSVSSATEVQASMLAVGRNVFRVMQPRNAAVTAIIRARRATT